MTYKPADTAAFAELTSCGTKYVLLPDCLGPDSVAIPLVDVDRVKLEPVIDDDQGRGNPIPVWRLSFEVGAFAYISPLTATRDGAIAMLRRILDSPDTLVDVAALPGWWER